MQVNTEHDRTTVVRVRSGLRLRNASASTVRVLCRLPAPSAAAAGSPTPFYGAPLAQRLGEPPPSADAADDVADDVTDDEASGMYGEGLGGAAEEALERTIAPEATLELPLWAMERAATMVVCRACSGRWDAPLSPLDPRLIASDAREAAGAPAAWFSPGAGPASASAGASSWRPTRHPSAVAGATPERADGGGGGGGGLAAGGGGGSGHARAMCAPRLRFFEAVASITPLLHGAGSRAAPAAAPADVLIELTWRAKLRNVLPLDVEVEATVPRGLPRGLCSFPTASSFGSLTTDGGELSGLGVALQPERAPRSPLLIRSGEQAELPIDELSFGLRGVAASHRAEADAAAARPAGRGAGFHVGARYDAFIDEGLSGTPDGSSPSAADAAPDAALEGAALGAALGTTLGLRLRILSSSGPWRWSRPLEMRLTPRAEPADARGGGAADAGAADADAWTLGDPQAEAEVAAAEAAAEAASFEGGGAGREGGGGRDRRGQSLGGGGEPQHRRGGGVAAASASAASARPLPGAATLTVSLGSGCTARLGIDPAAAAADALGVAGLAPQLLLWSPYWLINKTGLRLAYHLQRSQTQLDDTAEATIPEGAVSGADGLAAGLFAPLAPAPPTAPTTAPAAPSAAAAPPTVLPSPQPPTPPLASPPMMIACDAGERLVVQVRASLEYPVSTHPLEVPPLQSVLSRPERPSVALAFLPRRLPRRERMPPCAGAAFGSPAARRRALCRHPRARHPRPPWRPSWSRPAGQGLLGSLLDGRHRFGGRDRHRGRWRARLHHRARARGLLPPLLLRRCLPALRGRQPAARQARAPR